MSIADKLTYLQTTKQLLKTEINKINNVLDDNSTFRSYPQELFNGYLDILNNGTDTLWSNLEKVSQTGTEAVLEGVETAPIKMVLNGNTSQETTTGKNLLNLTDGTFTDGNNLTITIVNQEVTLNGSTNANYLWLNFIKKDYRYGTPNTSNKPTWFNTEILSSGIYVGSTTNTDNFSTLRVFYTDGTISNLSNIDSSKNIAGVGMYVATSGKTFNNEKIKIQIEEGSTATSWEKYTGGIPSPSPDYPQQVKVVKGENVVSVQGKNWFDKSSVSLGSNWNGAIGTTCYPFNSQITRATVLIPVEPSTTYHLELTQSEWYSMQILEASSTYEVLQTDSSVVSNNVDLQITTLSNTAYIGIKFKYGSAGTTEMVESLLSSLILMLNKGTTALPYEPYTGASYPINLPVGMELCKIGDYKDYFHKDSGKWYVHKEIGKVILDGSETWHKSALFYANVFFPAPLIRCNTYTQYFGNSADAKLENTIFVPSSYIWINTKIATTVEDFKTWLSTHNTIVYYVLKTPIEEEITNSTLIEQLEAISKAKSVKDKTYITQTNEELPFILDVEAIKEYEVD